MSESLPFINLQSQFSLLEKGIRSRMDQVLAHGRFIMGPEVVELEQELANYTGAKYCITVASGTEALLISLMALGIGPGDEVITTPFTFVATAEAIALLGAIPVFVDVQPDTCNLDVSLVELAITDKTKAIIPVSLYGQTCDMNELNTIADKYDVTVIEDAAQSFGATYQGSKSCNVSTIACASFFPSKPLGCYGDGGAIFTSSDVIAEACREIRVHGQSQRYVHTRVGVGGRMDTLQCAVVLAKLTQFPQEIENRLEIGAGYNDTMDKLGIDRVVQRNDRTSVFAQYTIFHPERDIFKEQLQLQGIPTAVHYPIPLNEQKAYEVYGQTKSTPVAHDVSKRVVSLPMSAYLTDKEFERVCRVVENVNSRILN